MKALSLGFLLAITTLSGVHAQRSPESLPAVTVDCYQSFAAKAPLPELPSKEIAIDGGSFETPLIRYRLQVADKTTLKIIKDPTRPAFRTEYGKSVWEINGILRTGIRLWVGEKNCRVESSGFSHSTLRISCLVQLTSHQRVRPPPGSSFM